MSDTKHDPDTVSDEMLDQIQAGADTNHQGWSDTASISNAVPTRNSAKQSIGAMRSLTIGAAKASVAGSGD